MALKACILAVGSEMLTPFKVDTNSLLVTGRLNAIGYDVRFKAVVGDDLDEMTRVLSDTLAWTDLLVVTGGLGPTEDDLTRDAVARVVNAPLIEDPAIVERIRARFAARGLTMSENNRRQAMVPRGAEVLENPNGSAPGLWLTHRRSDIVLLPGPPREMTPMLDGVILTRLSGKSGGAALYRRVLKITGRPESEVDALVGPTYLQWTTQAIPITSTILAALGQIELHLTATATDRAAANRVLDDAVAQLQEILGVSVYSVDGRPLEAVVGEMLRQRKMTIAVAESCSGGLLASRLTDVPGSSDYVERGVVCYSNRAKTELLGVPEAMIAEYGAVSEPVATWMAESIASRAQTNAGVGITGIAGPGGGTPQKPVGTVVVAVTVDGKTTVRTLALIGGREMVKFQSSQAALNMLRLMLA